MTGDKISQAEAERLVAEEYERTRLRWKQAVSAAKAVAEARGLNGEVALAGYSPEGEYFRFETERFLHDSGSGNWDDVWDTDVPAEQQSWQELDRVLSSFDRSLPPRSDDLVTKPEDIIDSEHDLYMIMFGIQDSDGNFVYDDKGVVTEVEGLWL